MHALEESSVPISIHRVLSIVKITEEYVDQQVVLAEYVVQALTDHQLFDAPTTGTFMVITMWPVFADILVIVAKPRTVLTMVLYIVIIGAMEFTER